MFYLALLYLKYPESFNVLTTDIGMILINFLILLMASLSAIFVVAISIAIPDDLNMPRFTRLRNFFRFLWGKGKKIEKVETGDEVRW